MSTTKLNLTPETIHFPASAFVFVEKIGPFQETARTAWQEIHQLKGQLKQVSGSMALFKIGAQMVYRAGFIVSAPPNQIAPPYKYEEFGGGKYFRFTLTGSYAQLPVAWGQVFDVVAKQNLKLRAGAFNIEHYVTDPSTTAEAELRTDLLIPAE